MVPTLLGVLAAVLVVVAVQIQVRAVREPGLARRHGEAYEAYAARTGRFLPRAGARDPDSDAGGPRPATDRARRRAGRPPGRQRSSSYGTARSCSATSAGSASSGRSSPSSGSPSKRRCRPARRAARRRPPRPRSPGCPVPVSSILIALPFRSGLLAERRCDRGRDRAHVDLVRGRGSAGHRPRTRNSSHRNSRGDAPGECGAARQLSASSRACFWRSPSPAARRDASMPVCSSSADTLAGP